MTLKEREREQKLQEIGRQSQRKQLAECLASGDTKMYRKLNKLYSSMTTLRQLKEQEDAAV